MKVWLTKNKDGGLFAFTHKPYKDTEYQIWDCDDGDCLWWCCNSDIGSLNMSCFIFDNLSEDVNPKWSDNEPIEVEIKIEKV